MKFQSLLMLLSLLVFLIGCNQPTISDAGSDVAQTDPAAAADSPKQNSPVNESPEAKKEVGGKLDAQKVLDEAIAAANSQEKNLFVHFGADW